MVDDSSISLRQRLASHSTYIGQLIGMVPPKFYLPADPEEMARKYHMYKNKQPHAPKHEKKLRKLENKRARLGKDGHALSADGLKVKLAEKLQQFRSGRGGAPKTAAQRAAENKGKEKQPKHVAGGMNKAGRPQGDADAAGSSAPGSGGGSQGETRAGSGGIEFNKLAAAAAAGTSKQKRKLSTAALLAQAEETERRRRARLSAPDGGGEDLQIEEWQRALQKAGGIKQKDNPALLKKALKRQERKKKKSTKEWSSRIKTVAKTMRERQEKRRENLKERATKNKNRATKNKARAGFEGKKSSFL